MTHVVQGEGKRTLLSFLFVFFRCCCVALCVVCASSFAREFSLNAFELYWTATLLDFFSRAPIFVSPCFSFLLHCFLFSFLRAMSEWRTTRIVLNGYFACFFLSCANFCLHLFFIFIALFLFSFLRAMSQWRTTKCSHFARLFNSYLVFRFRFSCANNLFSPRFYFIIFSGYLSSRRGMNTGR